MAVELEPGLEHAWLEHFQASQDSARELNRRVGRGGDQVAVGHRGLPPIQVAPSVAGAGQELGSVAGVGPVVEQAGQGQATRGAADGSHGNRGVEELARLVGERSECVGGENVVAWQNQHRTVGRLQIDQ